MRASSVVLVTVNILSIALVSLLLLTSYVRKIPRHPVVSTLMWTAIPRSMVAALPAFYFHRLAHELPFSIRDRQLQYQTTSLARMCAAQGILMYYFLAVQAAFAVSFTVPLFLIARQSLRVARTDSRATASTAASNPKVRLPSTLLLCISPFLWSLPIPVFAVPVIIQAWGKHSIIYFNNTGYCSLDYTPYQQVSGTLVGIPLIIGAVLAIVTVFYVLAHCRARARPSRVDIPLVLRFAILLLIIYLDAILLLCEISLPDQDVRGVWKFDLYWTTVTPLIEFGLFGTQTAYLRTWQAWFRCTPRRRPKRPSLSIYTGDVHVVAPSPPARRRKHDDEEEDGVRYQDESGGSIPLDDQKDPVSSGGSVSADERDREREVPRSTSSRSARSTPISPSKRSQLFLWERPPEPRDRDDPAPVPPSPRGSTFRASSFRGTPSASANASALDLERAPSTLGLTPAARQRAGALDFMYNEMSSFIGAGSAVSAHHALALEPDDDVGMGPRNNERRRPSTVALLQSPAGLRYGSASPTPTTATGTSATGTRYGTDGRPLSPSSARDREMHAARASVEDLMGSLAPTMGARIHGLRAPPAPYVPAARRGGASGARGGGGGNRRFQDAHDMWPLQQLSVPPGVAPGL